MVGRFPQLYLMIASTFLRFLPRYIVCRLNRQNILHMRVRKWRCQTLCFRGLVNRRVRQQRGLMNFQNSTHTLRLNSQCRNRPQRAHFSISIAEGGSEQNPLFRPCGLSVSSRAQSLTCRREPWSVRITMLASEARFGIYADICVPGAVLAGLWLELPIWKKVVFFVTEGLPGSLSSRGHIQDSPRSGRRPEDLFAFSGTEGLRRGLQSER